MNDGEIRLTDVESPRWITDVHEVRGGPGTVVGGMVVGGGVVGGDVVGDASTPAWWPGASSAAAP